MRGGTHGVLLVSTDALELVQGMVPELSRGKQETCLQHAERIRKRNGVEILHLDFGDKVLIVRQRDLVKVAVLTLDEEEEEVLQLVRCVGNNQQTLLLRHLQSAWDGANDVRVALLLVYEAVLAADEDTTGPVHAAGHRDERVRGVVHRVRELPRHVVQPQVHLVERKHLLRRVCVRIPVHLFIAQFNGCKQWILEANVHTARRVHQGVALVRL
mmetsp:Transcript_20864/g.58887  ORF Transcript_20864/g.58887 Transcript_20864/m.58887 type:complete len:214 (+) Transcript_20864:2598-3239(+)